MSLLSADFQSRPTGRFVYHVLDDTWDWDDDVYRIHGFEPRSIRPTTDLIHASKHPDDLERVREVLAHASRHGGSFAVAYRLLRADGTERQVVLTGYGDSSSGGVQLVEGYYIDLTMDFDEQIRSEAQRAVLASSETRAKIEQAKGVLMLAYGLDADAAFAMLQWWSKNHNVKVRHLAARLMDTARTRPAISGLHLSLDRLLYDLTSNWPEPAGNINAHGSR